MGLVIMVMLPDAMTRVLVQQLIDAVQAGQANRAYWLMVAIAHRVHTL